MLSLSFLHRLSPKPSFPSLSAVYPLKASPPQSLLLMSTHSFLSLCIRSISPTATATATATPKPNSLYLTQMLSSNSLLKMAIIGFGSYGQFLAKTLVSQGHTVLAHSRTVHPLEAHSLGISFFLDRLDFCEQHPDVILSCTSINSAEEVTQNPMEINSKNSMTRLEWLQRSN
ncbi:hypothetical protein JCGZ_10457 [Jatropha curcas]|uniref:Pyrroline-5-carboxylate reductase catalytic N-terminal domain-containing protein n=1 Tax=Jatropha curcas TaxID=180498 RepID=A0A067KIE1_JATCU|nr:hypothetical protein JCGZ_10457 [Jatropha curcas]